MSSSESGCCDAMCGEAASSVEASLGLVPGEPKWKLVAAVASEAMELGPKKSNMLEEPSDDLALV